MPEQDDYIDALIELHTGLDRLGPGDDKFTEFIVAQITGLPSRPRIADLGCGAGAGALFLAKRFRSSVKAVDFSSHFLDRLRARAEQSELSEFIEIIEADIGNLGWTPGTIDLLWSEGAAYSITFTAALVKWRPLLVPDGIAVISEMNYFSAKPPPPLVQFMQDGYPQIQSEAENVKLINRSGFDVLGIHRLPAQAWWRNYYDPLRQKIEALGEVSRDTLRAVIRDSEAEMQCFETYAEDYGYTYFIMRAV